MFRRLEPAPPDPILGLSDAFRNDSNPKKINLGIGIYQDEDGRTPVFASVKKAEERLLREETSKKYLGIPGDPAFGEKVQELLLDETPPRAATAHTPGGTAAVRIGAELIRAVRPEAAVWLSDPTWANHAAVFEAAGMRVERYPYYDAENRTLAFDAMTAALERVPEGDVVLLHACCHNPTGKDPDAGQWDALARLFVERRLFPFFDFAYQGFGLGLDEDAAGVRRFARTGCEMLVASSFSKNFALYKERVGALTLLAESPDDAAAAMSHLKRTIRRCWSTPPAHGGHVVTTILRDPALRAEWTDELAAQRARIHAMRRLFAETLQAKGVARDFSHIVEQNGMFSFSGLNPAQVARLREDWSIYAVSSGRINVAGMTPGNMDYLCDAVRAVLEA